MVRCFTNIELSKEQRERISELIETLKPRGSKVKWVEEENLHITLNFLGEVPEGKVEKLKKEFETGLAGEKKFQLSLKGVGSFPNWNNPRVLWIGVENGAEETQGIAKKLSEAITVGEKEHKKFHPHVTIGRVKIQDNTIIKKLREAEGTKFGECGVDDVNIKKSTLTEKGAVYEVIKEVKLLT
ncbi:MAG: RNA 2',3'-cyclic phosphodiesterase [archaeon]